MTIPIWLKELGSSRRRRLLVIGGAVLTLGAGTVGVATPSGALRPDPPGDSVAAGAASAGVAPSAAVAAASDASPSATLTGLVYTFPAGSGGSLVRPLGISAFQGHVYVSNTSDNVLSDLGGGNTTGNVNHAECHSLWCVAMVCDEDERFRMTQMEPGPP